MVSNTKLASIFIVCLLGILLALPNMLSQQTVNALPSWMQNTVNLGLELRGGAHIQLEVDLKTATRDFIEQLKDEVRNTLRKEQIGYKNISISYENEYSVSLTLREQNDADKAVKTLSKIERTYRAAAKGDVVTLTVPHDVMEKRHQQILEQSIEVVRRRVDESGTKEPMIQRQGSDRIIVQLPGVEDPAEVKRMLGRTAKLTFRMVDHDAGDIRLGANGQPIGSPPAGAEYLEEVGHGGSKHYIAIKKEVKLTGDQLADARFQIDGRSSLPGVSIQFNTQGAKKFAEISGNNVGRRFAMVLDNKVISAPVFNEAIPSGQASISGNFTYKEANELALLLRAGSLPAPLHCIEEFTVGPSLGADSIQHGKTGVLVAFLFVSVLMLACYALFGGFAIIALTANLVLLFAGLSVLQATLTLPGIAGIALTIGMAVDANVLIYERIKEELRYGAKIYQAIQAGYNRAMTTIIDSNVTTLIGAAVLYEWGSGPIRGFAVTLALGILISLFTALSLSKAIILLWVKNKKNLTTLPI